MSRRSCPVGDASIARRALTKASIVPMTIMISASASIRSTAFSVAKISHSFIAKHLSTKRPNVKDQIHDCDNSDDKQNDRRNQCHRWWKLAFGVDQAFSLHCLALVSQSKHELHVINGSRDQHHNPESDQRNSKIARRLVAGNGARLSEMFECLCDREAKADQR